MHTADLVKFSTVWSASACIMNSICFGSTRWVRGVHLLDHRSLGAECHLFRPRAVQGHLDGEALVVDHAVGVGVHRSAQQRLLREVVERADALAALLGLHLFAEALDDQRVGFVVEVGLDGVSDGGCDFLSAA